MPVTVYKVDHNRVFTGEVAELGAKDPIFANSIMTPPPDTEGFHIWDGFKWFTRAEYPTPPVYMPPRQTVLTKLEFRSRFTLEEKVAIEQAKLTNTVVLVLMTDLELAEDINLDDLRIHEGLGYLSQQGLLSEARVAEIVA